MTKFILALLLLSTQAFAFFNFQYPEDRTYTSSDQGYVQYGAPSLHGTATFALTFDDGPHTTRTVQVLDTLKKYGVKATFFIITSQVNAETFPLIKRMLDEGHLVGSHGYTHDNSDKITKAQWKARVTRSFKELNALYLRAGHVLDRPFYRFPYAAYGHREDHHQFNSLKEISNELFGENCIQFAFWDIDSGDWIPGMTGQEVLGNFKANIEGGKFITYKTVRQNGKLTQIKVPTVIDRPLNGGVVLQHDVQASTVSGLALFLEYAKSHGQRTVRLDDVDEFRVTRQCRML
jgi:peptidoglycan/xylan/chitin deacetylase (PgdA/CDA1 family)